MKTYLAALAVLTVLATPSFAQSFDPEVGTGNVLSFRSEPAASQIDRFTVRRDGRNAYAAAPRARSAFRPRSNPNSPASTGGGSLGYNERLLID
ncbi:MAG TPA: hypothetical protein VGJ01_11270 [Pseudolabrys sp.]|jgi:hypothetical protein